MNQQIDRVCARVCVYAFKYVYIFYMHIITRICIHIHIEAFVPGFIYVYERKSIVS